MYPTIVDLQNGHGFPLRIDEHVSHKHQISKLNFYLQ